MKYSIWRILLLTWILGFSSHYLQGQTEVEHKKGQYRIWISKMDKSKKVKGFLFEAGDSLLTIMDYSVVGGSRSVEIENINKIKLRKKSKPGRGLLTGALVGFSIGAIIGLASGDDPGGGFISLTAGQKAILLCKVLNVFNSGIQRIA